jgi:hypothetical protein
MPRKRTTTQDNTEAQAALDAVISTQTAYWEALHELEAVTGRDLDSTKDYQGVTLEHIAAGDYDEG